MDRTRGIRARGNSIVIDFMYNGTRCRETLSIPPTKPNLKHADRLRSKVLHEIEFGNFNYSKAFPNSRNIKNFTESSGLINHELSKFLDSKKRICAHSTWRDYYSSVNHHLIPEFGDISLSELKTSHINE